MKFKIPFTVSSNEKLIKKSRFFKGFIKYKKNSRLKEYLETSGSGILREEYIGICLKHFVVLLVFLSIFLVTILYLMQIPCYFGFVISFLFSFFIFFVQMMYPRIFARRRERDIDKNLISALQDVLVQLNSGIPLFTILANIASSDYGELSVEFSKAVKKINTGVPEVNVIEEIGKKSTSVFFKRVLWQIGNSLKSGSDMSIVVKDSLKALFDEQYIQIQNYGNKLNPFIVFYMLSSVIVPSLSVAFLTIISSIVAIERQLIFAIFIGLFIIVMAIQVMFLGLIKSSRPGLL